MYIYIYIYILMYIFMCLCISIYVSVRTNYHHQRIDIIPADIAESRGFSIYFNSQVTLLGPQV